MICWLLRKGDDQKLSCIASWSFKQRRSPQTNKMDNFARIFNAKKPLIIVGKLSKLHACRSLRCVSQTAGINWFPQRSLTRNFQAICIFFSMRGYLLFFCGKTLWLAKILQDLLLKYINIGIFSRTFCSVIDRICQYPGKTVSLWCSGYLYYTISLHRFWSFEILFIASQGFMQYSKSCLEARFVLLYHCYIAALLYHC